MKSALKLLILLTLCFCVSCAAKVDYVPVYKTPECHIPARPVYTSLDPAQHLSSPANTERLMIILSDMSAYIKRLESTLKCYKAATQPPTNDGAQRRSLL